MKGLTHERIAKMLFPDTDVSMVEKVNRAIDTTALDAREWIGARVPGLTYRDIPSRLILLRAVRAGGEDSTGGRILDNIYPNRTFWYTIL